MFERFTAPARRVTVLAQEEARGLNHNYIGTEHLLLGLLREAEGIAAKSLQSLGISLEDTRTKIVNVVGVGEVAPAGHIPFTPRAKKVLELGLQEALRLGHSDIRPEHLLLGLIREGEGIGAHLLIEQSPRLRRVVLSLLGQPPQPPSKTLTVVFGGEEIFSKKVETLTGREHIGTFELSATFQPTSAGNQA